MQSCLCAFARLDGDTDGNDSAFMLMTRAALKNLNPGTIHSYVYALQYAVLKRFVMLGIAALSG